MAVFQELKIDGQNRDHGIAGLEVSYHEDQVSIQIKAPMDLKITYQKDYRAVIGIASGVNVRLFHYAEESVHAMELQMELAQNSQVRQLVLHDRNDLEIKEKYFLKRDAVLHCAFGELNGGSSQHEAHYVLQGQGGKLKSTYVYVNGSQSNKKNYITVLHETGYTEANVENYGVVAGKSSLLVNVDSKIVNGAVQSATHQTSRILTFEEGVNAKVVPSLYIDENDVQASHACSMGVIDEEHLYYLQSRGLTRAQAVGLIVRGYLSPLAEIFEDDELSEVVSHMIDTKAGEHIGTGFDS